jgi:hypothetical protein
MAFALTKYIFPIEKEILLSSHFDYKVDNPRSPEEKKLVKEFILESIKSKDVFESGLLTAPLSLRISFSNGDLKEYLKIEGNDEYAIRYFEENSIKEVIDLLTEIWIIIRFPDNGEFDSMITNRNNLLRKIMSYSKTDYDKRFNDLSSYCHLLSLIINDDENYHGESFLLNQNPYEIFFSSKNPNVIDILENFHAINGFPSINNFNWLHWLGAHSVLLKEGERLETLVIQDRIGNGGKKSPNSQKQTPKQKLLHFGNILKTSYEHLKNPELMLLLLVSIIEYLLTRNPVTNSDEETDSISKQLKSKCTKAVESQDKISSLPKKLAQIYTQRSNLAHGNYKDNFDEDKIIGSVYLLYKINKHLLNAFIDDRKLIDYLKDN